MAYKVKLDIHCTQLGCSRPARFEVRAYGSEPFGWFCGPHADARVKALTEAEGNNPGGFK